MPHSYNVSPRPDEQRVPGSNATGLEADKPQTTNKDDPFGCYRITKQILLLFTWFCIGLFNEIIGPTLMDLKDKLGVDYEQVSAALVAKSSGFAVGAVIGGFLHEKFYRQSELIISLSLLLASAATLVVPFSPYLAVVATMFAFSGIAEGIINSGGNTIVLDLWLDRAAGPMHSLHFAFGLGAMIAPQIASPFLSPDANDDDDSMTTESPTTVSWNATAEPPGESRIEICYGIVAGIVFLYAFVVLGSYLKGPPTGFVLREPSEKLKDMIRPSGCGHGNSSFAIELLTMLFLYFINCVGGEKAMGKFLFSFAVETEVQFTKSDASSLQTAFWASFTAGRLLGVPIGRFLPVWIFILGDTLGATTTAIVLSIYGHKNRVALWTTSCFMGLFISVAFANGMAWSNIYLAMNNLSVMILIIGGACGGFIYQYLSGYLFDMNPVNLGYIMVGYGCAMVLTFAVMQTIATIHGRRILRGKAESCRDGTEHLSSTTIGKNNEAYVSATQL